MASKFLQRLTVAAVLVGGVGLVLAQSAAALPRPGAPRSRPESARGFSLFAGAVGLAANANRVSCGLVNRGWQCTDYTNSSVLGGAYWPKGSPDQYVFNGGLQIAGIIPGSRASFAWAGDTIGAFFFDGTGFYQVGSGITNVFSSTSLDDIANWPSAAYVNDPTLYDASLLGRKSISEQDTWVRYWDGNTNYVLGRPHPMGLLVDQRTLAWNFPSGNQDILYFVTRFINITATDPARYAGLSQYGYSASDIADIVQVARDYKTAILGKFGVTLPDTGYWFTRVYAGPTQDPDVGSGGGGNFSTAVLPFNLEFAYTANFLFPTWQFPPDIFGAPFAVAPGFEGLKFLKGAEDASGHQIGTTMFTNTTNGGVFTDRSNVQALWRLASNNLIPTDGACNAPSNTPMCQLVQGSSDTRMYMYSGPVDIKPGESQVVVTAMVYAPAVATAIANDGYGRSLGTATFDLKPGVPGTPTGLLSAASRVGQTSIDTIRKIDRAVGWAGTGNSAVGLDANGNGILEQNEIPRVPRSLLDKSLVAQAVFDSKFLLPFAPESPGFFLIPSDGQVTVVWQQSPTEQPGGGDPYFAVASNPLNPLYDPDYRANDVEGYRIWRGRTQAEMTMIAQYDYSGTVMVDYTGQFSNDDYGSQCAPDIGVTVSCPASFFPHRVSLVGNVVQVPPGYHAQLITGGIINLKADTAVSGLNSGYPALRDTGVPFVYVDRSVQNGFRYFYAVQTFDVNSVKSGPTSLSSGLVAKTVTPRVNGGNFTAGTGSVQFDLVGSDGTVLNPTGTAPTLSATTGEFSGPALPTDGFAGLSGSFFADQLLLAGQSAYFRIDSLVPAYYHQVTYYLHSLGPITATAQNGPAGDFGSENGDHSFAAIAVALPANANLADSMGLGPVPLSGQATGQLTIRPPVYSSALADWMGDVAGSFYAEPTTFDSAGGSRWFSGANESTADPTLATVGGAGSLPNVTFIYKPTPYHTANAIFRRYYGTVMLVSRAADMKVYWGNTAGKPDSVVDVTHHVRVPWSDAYRASWGIIKDFVGDGLPASGAPSAPNGILSYHDFLFGPCLLGGPAGITTQGCATRTLDSVATIMPVAIDNSVTANGTGFGMYINGEPFIFQTTTLPQNTVWTYRAYYGEVKRTGTTYSFTSAPSNPAVPGLRLRAMVTGAPSTFSRTNSGNLTAVHTVPDPYYVTNALELTSSTKVLRFVNLPDQAIIRIYSVSGILVTLLTHNDPSGGGEQVWNLRNRNNQFVASGVYFYHVETPDGQKKIGRFTVVNYAQ